MKDFSAWHNRKRFLESKRRFLQFSEREIWWCGIGLNVGDEEDGKNYYFERPVCVVRKFNKKIFIGVPLTSTKKDSLFYFPHTTRNATHGSILLTQIKLFSAKRLERRIGRMDEKEFQHLKQRLRELFD